MAMSWLLDFGGFWGPQNAILTVDFGGFSWILMDFDGFGGFQSSDNHNSGGCSHNPIVRWGSGCLLDPMCIYFLSRKNNGYMNLHELASTSHGLCKVMKPTVKFASV